MNIVFRTDASLTIGHGHLMRCLTLADTLKGKGCEVLFICRDLSGNLLSLMEKKGHPVCLLSASSSGESLDWQEDAAGTVRCIDNNGGRADWVIVDQYELDVRWESLLREHAERILVIDDLANRVHDCDLLLDQNLVPMMRSRYVGKVPAGCNVLLGPRYAVLQPMYAELHNRIPPREGLVRRMFIFFGGVDSNNFTGLTLAAFLRLPQPESGIDIDVVVTDDNPHTETIRRQIVGHRNIQLHSGLQTLALLMAKADLAVGACGATSWERLCLGLPTLVVTLAENQRPVAAELEAHGLIRWLGHYGGVDESTIAKALSGLMQQGLDEEWSLRCLSAVDGNGVNRVCAALTLRETTPLRVRYAKLDDEALLLEWANDPITRRNAFSSETISEETHRYWFRSRLREIVGCRLYIVETHDGVALGQVRFEQVDCAWRIDYSLAPHLRGRGLGRPLLEAALSALREDAPSARVFGQVKNSNQSSCRVFESLGFKAKTKRESAVEYERVL